MTIQSSKYPNVFLAAQYRSGSTHMAMVICRLLGHKWMSTSMSGNGDEEQNVNACECGTLMRGGKGFVFQQHCKGTSMNSQILSAYGCEPVVVTRNIYDCLLSVKENLDKTPVCPGIFIPKDYLSWGEERKWLWVAYNVAPWIAAFATSWEETTLPHMTISYEDYFSDQVKYMGKILAHHGINDIPNQAIREAASKKDGRLAVGKVGRGKELLPSPIMKIVTNILAQYPRQVTQRLTR